MLSLLWFTVIERILYKCSNRILLDSVTCFLQPVLQRSSTVSSALLVSTLFLASFTSAFELKVTIKNIINFVFAQFEGTLGLLTKGVWIASSSAIHTITLKLLTNYTFLVILWCIYTARKETRTRSCFQMSFQELMHHSLMYSWYWVAAMIR